MKNRIALLPLLLVPLVAHAKEADTPKSLLTLERIYGPKAEFAAKSFSGKWLGEDGHAIVKLEAIEAYDGASGIVSYDARSWEMSILVAPELLIPPGRTEPLKVESFEFSKDQSRVLIFTNSRRVWRYNTRGDYWVLDRSARTLKRIGEERPASTLMFAKFSPNGERVAYVHENRLWVEDLLSGETISVSGRTSENIISGTSDWVNEEELGIRDGYRWSPDGQSIAFWQFDISGVPQMTMIDNTSQIYPETIVFPYPKTGQTNSASRVVISDVNGTRKVDCRLPGDPREHYVARIDWAPTQMDSDEPAKLIIQQLNRLQNTNRMFVCDQRTGQAKEVLVEQDDAWVDVHDEMFWSQDRKHFTWISERTGWRTAYSCNAATGKLRRLTPDGVDAIELVGLDEASDSAYVIASPSVATDRYLYRADLVDGEWQRLSPKNQVGTHRYSLSPDGKFAIHSWSNINQPTRSEIVSLPGHKSLHVLEENEALVKRLGQLRRRDAKLIQIGIEPGVKLDAWCIEPPKMKPGKRYPLLVYVYGEPAGTTVRNSWGGSRFLWHQMLAQQGYVVMSIDNRGTPAPKGRDWRKSIYRRIGINAPADQAAAIRQILKKREDIDPERIGVWGWSGGGSMTLHAMFQNADLYKVGISIAPVPNMRYYDTIYQERYMGLPSDNVDGYKDGSPITHVKNLRGKLLLVHGTGDDNCHYATMEMLIDELIRQNKQFSMMSYPNRTHSIREGTNTTFHLRSLMTGFIHENLPAGPQ